MGAIIRLERMPENCKSCPFSDSNVEHCRVRNTRITAGKRRNTRMPLCPLQNEGEYLTKITKIVKGGGKDGSN